MPKRTSGDPVKRAIQALKEKDKEQAKLDKATYDYGVLEGRRQMKFDVLTLLQSKYLADDAPDKGTPEAQAILTLAAIISTEAGAIPVEAVHPE